MYIHTYIYSQATYPGDSDNQTSPMEESRHLFMISSISSFQALISWGYVSGHNSFSITTNKGIVIWHRIKFKHMSNREINKTNVFMNNFQIRCKQIRALVSQEPFFVSARNWLFFFKKYVPSFSDEKVFFSCFCITNNHVLLSHSTCIPAGTVLPKESMENHHFECFLLGREPAPPLSRSRPAKTYGIPIWLPRSTAM